MIKIAIDDGHGRETAGKRTPMFSDGTVMRENEFNEGVAKFLCQRLRDCGFEVIYTAPETTDVSLSERVRRANSANANAFVSIHANAYGSDWNDANGVETLVYSKVMPGSQTDAFAQEVHRCLVKKIGLRDRGIKRRDDLYVLKNTKMHAILMECGFMTNEKEANFLRQKWFQKNCADGIFEGICHFFRVKMTEEVEAEEEEIIMTEKRYQTYEEVPEWGKSTVKKLLDKGGFANAKKLDLTEEMLRMFVVLERIGKI